MLLVLRMRWISDLQRPFVNDRRNAKCVEHKELLALLSWRLSQATIRPQGRRGPKLPREVKYTKPK
jgi:hypothetical protein